MKKLVLTFAIVLAAIVGLTAQVANPTTETPQAAPKIQFTETTFDYGNIPQGIPATHNFKFTNTGNAPLLITNAAASCGCTVPEYTKDPIAPGKTGEIKVVYNAGSMGNFSKSVTVTSNAGEVALNIQGNVIDKPADPKPVVGEPKQ